MTRIVRQRVTASAVVVADAVVLRVCCPVPTTLALHLAHPREWVGVVGADTACAELARTGLWLCAAWLATAIATVVASALPGATGRLAGAIAARAVPVVLRRGVAAAIGASVVLTPLAAGASPAGAPVDAKPTGVSVMSIGAGASAASDGWPWPSSVPTTTPNPSKSAEPPTKPVPWPHTSTTPRQGDIVVRSGDCLWAIAAHRLGPHARPHEIAVESHRWYRANATTIGSDPGLIQPGQHLHQPHGTSTDEKGPRS